jgi:hypothetical protein
VATDDDERPADDADDVDAGDQDDAGDEDDAGDQDDAGDASADDDRTPRASRSGGAVSDGAGWVLGLLLWAGVVLPFIHDGPTGVKAWWMAKFLNKAPDGSALP